MRRIAGYRAFGPAVPVVILCGPITKRCSTLLLLARLRRWLN
jgi:hypothetical protein